MRAATHISNRVYTRRTRSAPVSMLTRIATQSMDSEMSPRVDHLRVIGCRAFVLIPAQRRTASAKFDAHATPGVLVGYKGTTN